MKYKAHGSICFREEDIFEMGCQPFTGDAWYDDLISFSGKTPEEVIKKITEHFSVSFDALYLNSCDEIGRIDISRMENTDGDIANEREIEQWKRGAIKLFSAIYTMHMKKCEPVDLSGIKSL